MASILMKIVWFFSASSGQSAEGGPHDAAVSAGEQVHSGKAPSQRDIIIQWVWWTDCV